jgi:hypothetical protein
MTESETNAILDAIQRVEGGYPEAMPKEIERVLTPMLTAAEHRGWIRGMEEVLAWLDEEDCWLADRFRSRLTNKDQ